MCGIVGYIGEKKAKPILINGLLRLEYRGYDSAGIATMENSGIRNIKNKGRVSELEKIDGIEKLEGTLGIGHTRWATHGKPSSTNSHPHLDNSEKFAVVHNGIIENYADLKEFLKSHKYHFLSETDTEVIPNLIHFYYESSKEKNEKRFMHAVTDACKMLKGSYALEILCSDFPKNMVVVRKDSPLVIGKGTGECYISSDIPAILSFTKDFYLLNDKEFAFIDKNNVTFYDENLNKIDKELKNITWNAGAAEKDGYVTYIDSELENGILDILKNLPLKYRDVFMLKYVNHMENQEIAEVCGILEGTVRQRIARGKVMIERKIKEMEENLNGENTGNG